MEIQTQPVSIVLTDIHEKIDLSVLRPVSVVLEDIFAEQKFGLNKVAKRWKKIVEYVHAYNSADQIVAQYFKRITRETKNPEDIFDICQLVFKELKCDCKFTEMLAEAMVDVLVSDICRLDAIRCDESLSIKIATDRIQCHEEKMSKRYILLAKILQRSTVLHRECLLTAFSLHPNWANYTALKVVHKKIASSKQFQMVDGMSSILPAEVTQMKNYNAMADPMRLQLKGDQLGTKLAKSGLYDDLATVVMSPRIKTLCWSKSNWPKLQKVCQQFLDDPKYKTRLISQTVAAVNKDHKILRYVNAQSMVLPRRWLDRTVKRLKNRKARHRNKRYVTCANTDGDLMGFTMLK